MKRKVEPGTQPYSMAKEKRKNLKKFAVFVIGEEYFGIEISRVVEILNTQKIHSIPEMPDFLSGVITIRGEIIPIIDLRQRLCVRSSSEKELIIVIKYDNEKVGILVDTVKEIISLTDDEIIIPPSIFRGLKRKYLSGLGKKWDRIIIILNLDDLLTSEEKVMLKEAEEILGEDAGTAKTA
jgi:purine-binding chemotaxis protein CheW